MSWECACGITNKDNAMKCGGCGWTLEQSKEYLENLKKGVPTTVQGISKSSSKALPYGILGFLLGCTIGFLMRPSVFLVGQLPFFVVLTRGAGLKGADAMFIPAAQTSFNYIFVAGILGAILGGFIGNSLGKKSVAPGGSSPEAQISQSTSGSTGEKYCGYCGVELQRDSLFCPKCGNKKAP